MLFFYLNIFLVTKIDMFSESVEVFNHTDLEELDPNFYKIESVHLTIGNTDAVRATVEKTTVEQLVASQTSLLTHSTNERPLYRFKNNTFTFNPELNPLGRYVCFYIRKPHTPNWGYVVVNDKTLYNDNISVDFELHPSEESELVYRILAYAGISIQKPEITQVAAQALSSQIQQEKQ